MPKVRSFNPSRRLAPVCSTTYRRNSEHLLLDRNCGLSKILVSWASEACLIASDQPSVGSGSAFSLVLSGERMAPMYHAGSTRPREGYSTFIVILRII